MFEQKEIEPEKVLEARKEKIGPEDAWEIISARKEVAISKGKKILTFVPEEASREEILKAAMGRSGTLRAPAVDTGSKMIIGFTEGIYEGL